MPFAAHHSSMPCGIILPALFTLIFILLKSNVFLLKSVKGFLLRTVRFQPISLSHEAASLSVHTSAVDCGGTVGWLDCTTVGWLDDDWCCLSDELETSSTFHG